MELHMFDEFSNAINTHSLDMESMFIHLYPSSGKTGKSITIYR